MGLSETLSCFIVKVKWFDEDGGFHARGYVIEQPYTIDEEGNHTYTIPAQNEELTEYVEKIDVIEKRCGVDFFPNLKTETETTIEQSEFEDLWD